jgi:acyl-CoA thioesterase FadM
VTYIREVLNGDTIVVRSGVLRVGGKSVTSVHQLYNATGELSATLESVTVQFDLKNRAAVALLPSVAEGARKLIVALPERSVGA